jgi:hypothetical protein
MSNEEERVQSSKEGKRKKEKGERLEEGSGFIFLTPET